MSLSTHPDTIKFSFTLSILILLNLLNLHFNAEFNPKINFLSSEQQSVRKKKLKSACQNVQKLREKMCSYDNFSVEHFVNVGISGNCPDSDPVILALDGKHGHFNPKYNWIVEDGQDRDQKFAFCLPPKAACTSWQRFYLAVKLDQIDYLDPSLDPNSWEEYIYAKTPRLKDKPRKIVHDFLTPNKYKKIITSRHPFERIYSGWKDKFRKTKLPSEFNKIWPEFYKPKVLKFSPKYLRNRTDEFFVGDQKIEMEVTFEQFMHYLANEDIFNYQEHFIPVSVHCSPCDFELSDISYLAKSETLKDDLIPAFESLNLTEREKSTLVRIESLKERLPVIAGVASFGGGRSESARKSSAQEVFRAVKVSSPEIFEKVYEKFKYDFLLFGYSREGYE